MCCERNSLVFTSDAGALFTKRASSFSDHANARQATLSESLGDAALRDMARRRPSTPEHFLEVKGVGQKKSRQYSKVILDVIKEYCAQHAVGMDVE